MLVQGELYLEATKHYKAEWKDYRKIITSIKQQLEENIVEKEDVESKIDDLCEMVEVISDLSFNIIYTYLFCNLHDCLRFLIKVSFLSFKTSIQFLFRAKLH